MSNEGNGWCRSESYIVYIYRVSWIAVIKKYTMPRRTSPESCFVQRSKYEKKEEVSLWWALDRARHIVPTALLIRVQCFRKGLYKTVEGPSTRPIVLLMTNGSSCRRRSRLTFFEADEMKFGVNGLYCRRQRRLTIFEPDVMKFGVSLTSLRL